MSGKLHTEIIRQLPHLRAFALMLSRDRVLADELVQEAVVRALAHADQFQPNSNFKAWITTILRNCYFNELRHRSRLSQLDLGAMPDEPSATGGQEERLELRDFNRAFGALNAARREALTLVSASGLSYEEAAKVAHCAVGTMKSRVSRAREQLQRLLDGDGMPSGDGRSFARDVGSRANRARLISNGGQFERRRAEG